MAHHDTGAPSRRAFLTRAALAGALAVLPGGARAQGGPKPVKLLHASNGVLPLWSVTYLAEDMGFYREEGLAPTRLGLANGPTAMTAMLTGAGDTDASTPGEMLGAVAQGLAEREAALRTARGARYGITAPGSLTDVLTRMAIRHVGLDPARDANILPMQSINNGVAGLANNGIECFMGTSPFNEQAVLEIGAVPILGVGNGELRAGARLQGQVRADVRALRMIVTRPDEARDVLRRSRFSSIREEIWPTVWQNQLPTFTSPYVGRDSVQAWIETGLIGGNPNPATFPYDQAIDMRFVAAAVQRLGWSIAPPA
jgi:hypothetical protein